jgi:hypothetical protein
MLNLLFALIGLLVGIIINILADNLPERMRPQPPYCLQCGHPHALADWPAISRRLRLFQLWCTGTNPADRRRVEHNGIICPLADPNP